MTRKPLTKHGSEKLRDALRRLKTVERPRIIQAIAEARAHGDLSENAEYHAAREQQGFIEGRIKEIEHALSHCQIIDVSVLPPSTRVVFGATVQLADQEDGSELRYQIVGEFEADARLGLISITSPIARALVGKNEGDLVEVAVPGGIKAYEIVAVRYSG
jgi:transcription elongation factor GreA